MNILMGKLLLIVIFVFVILFAIAIPTVVSDMKAQRQKEVNKEF